MKYVHTNIIARDWKSLAQFYMDVFDCQIAPPERDLHGLWADQLSGIDNVRIRGVHLRLPGYTDGPTLEIFQYEPAAPGNNEPVPLKTAVGPGCDTQGRRDGFCNTRFLADHQLHFVSSVSSSCSGSSSLIYSSSSAKS